MGEGITRCGRADALHPNLYRASFFKPTMCVPCVPCLLEGAYTEPDSLLSVYHVFHVFHVYHMYHMFHMFHVFHVFHVFHLFHVFHVCWSMYPCSYLLCQSSISCFVFSMDG